MRMMSEKTHITDAVKWLKTLPQESNQIGDSALETATETYHNTRRNSKRLDEAQHYLK